MACWEYMHYIHLLNSVRAGRYVSLLQHAAQGLNTCTSFNIIPVCRIRVICTRYKVMLIFLCYNCIPFFSHLNNTKGSNNQAICFRIFFFKTFLATFCIWIAEVYNETMLPRFSVEPQTLAAFLVGFRAGSFSRSSCD